MGVLEDILQRSTWMPTTTDSAFPDAPHTWTPEEEAAQARAADDAAAKKMMRANRPGGPPGAVNPLTQTPDAQSAGVQLAMDQAPAGTGVPFSTQAGMLPPVTIQPPPNPNAEPNPSPVAPGAVPLPVPRPANAPAAPTDVSSSNRSPTVPAAPTDAVAPAAPAPTGTSASPFQLPSILDKIRTTLGDNSNTLLAVGAGFAGAPNWGQAISRAASAAIPARAADIKQKLYTQTQGTGYKALVEAGVPTNLAIAAMGNPEMMKAVTENYLSDRKGQLTDIGFDRYGNPIKGVFDPYTKKVTPLASALDTPAAAAMPRTAANAATAIAARSPAAPDPALPGKVAEDDTDISSSNRTPGANPANPANPSDPTVPVGAAGVVTAENDITGPDYLEHLRETDPQYARQVEQIVNGDAPMPTGRLANTPVGRKLRQDVLTVEPGMSDADFAKRQATGKSYTSGNDAKVTKSINTTLHHAQTLESAINGLNNADTLPGAVNPARALVRGQLDPDYQAKRAQYQTAVANFAKELDFAVSGGRPTVSGTNHQMEGFDANASHAAQIAKLREGVDLLNGRLESHAEGYSRGMKKQADPMDFIEPRNKQFFQRITGSAAPDSTAAAAPAAITAPSAPAGASAAPPVSSKAEYDALPAGQTYTAPDGSVRTKK